MINKQKGFTLLETLVAISIVTLTIIGPLAMAAQASKLISVAKNQLTATYLAQEAMELVRYQKDSNMIEAVANTSSTLGYDWLRGVYTDADEDGMPDTAPQGKLFNCINSDENSCYINFSGPQFIACSDVDAHCTSADPQVSDPLVNKAFLWKHVDDGYVLKEGYSSGLTQTSFRRYVQIIPILNAATEEIAAKVIVKVEWDDTYGHKKLYVQENIYKYR